MKPRIFILTGPSGAGKSTIADHLLLKTDLPLRYFVTCTTRAARPHEKEGEDYWFKTREEFEQGIAEGDFFEWANVYGNYYGSSKKELERLLANSDRKDILMILDVQGFKTMKSLYPETVAIYLDAPRESLRGRLERRHAPIEEIERRLAKLTEEETAKSVADFVVPSLDGKLPEAIRDVEAIVRKNAESRATLRDFPRSTSGS